MTKNCLYYGDNLPVLREHIKDESVDLIYLDPPFNSRQDYNVLFAERDGTRSASQFRAFEDTWEWNAESVRSCEEIIERGGRVSDAILAFRTFLGNNDMMAYLAMMAPRLIELHRVLKVTGSIYLHCDPTASHYLKMLMDAVFGPQFFRNEIIWERTTGRKGVRQFGRVHDVLIFYSRSDVSTWNPPITPQDEDNAKGHDLIRNEESGKLYRLSDLTGAGQGPPRSFDGKVIKPPKGRHWGYDQDGIYTLWAKGRIAFSLGGNPRLKTYIEDLPGVAVRDIWTDIEPLNSAAAERLGYPTQKPEALLERIIKASSKEGDTVLDPFCGCGTATAVAQRLSRRWIGIDITHLAIGLIKRRFDDAFGESIRQTYEVIGEPVDLAGARELAATEPYQFQWWALSLVGAPPYEKKKGADQGIDGRIHFHMQRGGETNEIILSVKAGHVQASHIRDLRGVIEREKAKIGVLISMEPPTKPMTKEAVEAGFWKPQGLEDRFARIQILSIKDLLEGKQIHYPRYSRDTTYRKAPKSRKAPEQQIPLGGEIEETF